jgi:sulfite reductase (NADPH) flavoprotein alpha-component
MNKSRFSTPDAATLGNIATIVALVAVCVWLALVQREAIGWNDPGARRIVGAVLCVLIYAGFCRRMLRRHAQRAAQAQQVDAPADVRPLLVAYASQTGFAELIAVRTARSLREAGVPVRVESLAKLTADDFADVERALFIVSTYGEGDPPDVAAAFARRQMSRDVPLPNLAYGLLALGDREYVHFCGFGHALDRWLRHQGARPLFDLVEVDNADPGALRHWQHQVGVLSGATDAADWAAPQYTRWRLTERRLMNAGSQGGPCFHVALVPENAADLVWDAGDVAEIGPRNAPDDIDAWLAAAGVAGSTVFEGETVRARVARSRLPEPPVVRGDWREALGALEPLAHREYSIASLPADGALHVLVRQWRRPDGRLGVGGGWLTEHASVGNGIDVRLRRNTNFHAPPDARPLILVGNGTGIAGLRALLKTRIAAGRRRNWLVFGEREAAVDLLYGDELRAWQAQGLLERLDLAFSRDQAERVYVQHRLAQASDALRAWIDDGAAIYVCGSLEGMAPGVHAVLVDVLGTERVEQLVADGRYRRDVY